MPVGDHSTRVYAPGSTIRVELALSDDSGIDLAAVPFALMNDPSGAHRLWINGRGRGDYQEKLILSGVLKPDLPLGTYEGLEAHTKDLAGNRSVRTLAVPIRFTLEGATADTEGPAVGDWGFQGGLPASGV